MRKRIFGRRFKRTKNQRQELFRSLMRALILDERIKTTEAKAKSIKGEIERLVTSAKNNGELARHDLLKNLNDQAVVEKVIGDISKRFANHKGGYTRIVRLGERLKDAAPMVIMEWVEKNTDVKVITPKVNNKEKKDLKSKKSEKVKTEIVVGGIEQEPRIEKKITKIKKENKKAGK